MSEKLSNLSEEAGENQTSGASSLEEMANQFDPAKAEEEKRRAIEEMNQSKENVIATGDVSRLIKDENGKVKLESDYLDLYYDYAASDKYDSKNPEDRKLGLDIWEVGFHAALLDTDKTAKEKLQNLEDLSKLEPSSAENYKKIFNAMIELSNSGNRDTVKGVMERIDNSGEFGEFLVGVYESIEMMKEAGKPLRPYKLEDLSVESNNNEKEKAAESKVDEKFNNLEQRFQKINSRNGKISPEEVNDLLAEYKDYSRNITDPKTLEEIKAREEHLASLSDQLEEIAKKIASIGNI